MMRIFVTGGAGFIGSHTVDVLVAAGNTVTVYDKKSWEGATNLHGHGTAITYVQGDILDFPLLKKNMEGHTHVLHLAAVVSVPLSFQEPLITHQVNVDGTAHVFEAARIVGVSRVVYASSAAVYGNQDVVPIEEDAPLMPESPYALHKMCNESYADLYARHFGISTMGLRYFNVCGTRQDPSSPYSGVISIFCARAKARLPVTIFGDGSATRDFVSVRDVARANTAALHASASGVCNIGSGTETSLKEILTVLQSLTGQEVPCVYEKARLGDIAHSLAAIDRAKTLIGFTPSVSFSQALRDILEV